MLSPASSIVWVMIILMLYYLKCGCFQRDQERNKNTFEQEEKMMVSAWYNLVCMAGWLDFTLLSSLMGIIPWLSVFFIKLFQGCLANLSINVHSIGTFLNKNFYICRQVHSSYRWSVKSPNKFSLKKGKHLKKTRILFKRQHNVISGHSVTSTGSCWPIGEFHWSGFPQPSETSSSAWPAS